MNRNQHPRVPKHEVRDKNALPSHNRCDHSKTTTNLQEFRSIGQSFRCWVVADLIVGSSDEAEKENEGEENEHERQVGAEGAQEENEADHAHDNGIVSLARVVRFACRAINTVRSYEGVRRVSSVSQVDPMAAIDDEDDERESVAKDEFGDTSDVHGNTAQEVIRTTDTDGRCGV